MQLCIYLDGCTSSRTCTDFGQASVNLSQRLNIEQRGDSTSEQATPRARTSASAYAA